MNFLQAGFFVVLILKLLLGVTRRRRGKVTVTEGQGGPFNVRVARGKDKVVNRVSIALDLADNLRFRLRRENRFDRLAKNFGIAREWQTGDADFDGKIFILSEDWALNEALSADRELREICAQLIAYHRGEIECKSGRLYFDFNSSGSKDTSDKTVAAHGVRDWGATLVRFRARLLRITADRWEAARDPSLTRKAWLVGISMVLGVGGLAALFFGISHDERQVVHTEILHHTAWSTVAVVGSLLAAIFLWLRASPHTHAVLIDVLFAALPGSYLAADAAFTIYNQDYDRSGRLAPVHVEQTYWRKSKSSRTYYMVAAGWPDPRGDRVMKIKKSEFDWMVPGTCITAIWHEGALGDGWVSGYQHGCPSDTDVER